MLSTSWYVFLKETRDLLRDRRALLFLFATPLLMPLLGALGGAFVVWQVLRQTKEGLPVLIINGDQLPGLVAELEDKSLLQLTSTSADTEQALQSGKLMAVLEIPPDAMERIRAEQPLTLTLTSSRSGWLPDVAVTAIRDALTDYERGVLIERLEGRGLNPAWLNPIRLERTAAAPTGVTAAPLIASETAPAIMGNVFLTMVIISWIFSGGLILMADMTVGEKERRTMEPLLVTSSSRVGIVLGKIALSIIVSAITIGLWSLDSLAYVSLLSVMPASSAMPIEAEDLTISTVVRLGSLGQAFLWLMLLMLPLMTMANGVVAAICAFAKDQRESNLFLGLFQLLLPGLALLTTFGVDATPSMGTYALPIVGVMVALRDLFGGGVAPEALALTWTIAVVYAMLSILLAAYVFSREWALMRGV